MELLNESELFVRVDELLQLKSKIDIQACDCQGYDLARKLAIEYWVLMDSLEICILSCGSLVKDSTHASDMLYANLIEKSKESSAAGKKQSADNNIEYLQSCAKAEKFELYLSYLKNIRENLNNGYDMMKLIYKNEVTILQLTPKM